MLKQLRRLGLVVLSLTLASAQETDSPPSQVVISAAASSFHEYSSGDSFDSILASHPDAQSGLIIRKTFDPVRHASVFPAPDYPNEHMSSLVGLSDAVMVGTPVHQWIYPTDGHQFTVSIYLVHVLDVAVEGSSKVVPGQDIYVARAGGSINYDGHLIRAVDPNFPAFDLNDRYIFFGKIVGPNLYKVDSEHSLKVVGRKVVETSTSNPHASFYRTQSVNSILTQALDASQHWSSVAKRSQP